MVDELAPEPVPPLPKRIIKREAFRDPAFSKMLTQDPFLEKARERIWAALHAQSVLSIKEERSAGNASDDEFDRMFGKGNWMLHRGRVIFRVENTDAQIAAAREVLSRGEPQLNRADPGSTRTFRVFRIDPNEAGDPNAAIGVQVEEIEDGEIIEVPAQPVDGEDAEPTEVGEAPEEER